MLRVIPLGLALLYRYYPLTWRILWLTFYYCYCSCFLFLFLFCYGKMQFSVHCNFFCLTYLLTYLLIYYLLSNIWRVPLYRKCSKYFIGYKNNEDVIPVCVLLPRMRGYLKCFDDAKTMSFLVNNKKLLKKYKAIWSEIMNWFLLTKI